MAEITIEQMAIELEKDDRWLKEHLEQLVRKYPRKVIAILNEQIVAVGDSVPEVWKAFEEKHPDRVPMIFQIPTPADFQCALKLSTTARSTEYLPL